MKEGGRNERKSILSDKKEIQYNMKKWRKAQNAAHKTQHSEATQREAGFIVANYCNIIIIIAFILDSMYAQSSITCCNAH